MDITSTTILNNFNDCYYNYIGNETYHECKLVSFNKTPPVSTYLVAMVVGIYDSISNITSNNLPVSMYYPISQQQRAIYGLKVTTAILPYYETIFGVSYPLPKMDLIALNDFGAGAMENWVRYY